MAQLQVVSTNRAPEPLPQFSQAVKHNGMVYCSGNIGIAPPPLNWLEELSRIGRQVGFHVHLDWLSSVDPNPQRQALRNLSVILEAAGSNLRNVVKMNIYLTTTDKYLTTMDNFAMMNEAYDEVFVWETKPVRSRSGSQLFLLMPSSAGLVLLSTSYPLGLMWKLSALLLQPKREYRVDGVEALNWGQCIDKTGAFGLCCPSFDSSFWGGLGFPYQAARFASSVPISWTRLCFRFCFS